MGRETGGLGFDMIVDCHVHDADVEAGGLTSRINALAPRGVWVANDAVQVRQPCVFVLP
jgi:hypothetical protein